ncbi:thioredoxin [Halomarina ordinaria]|uniref:Thioredoxin n=1 Tax=Halomarina ordinaria TaxID=3033939 RepID=A0ABD5U955_9EURY|nr:thioredoxin [Halomarina sp. PSRA2]
MSESDDELDAIRQQKRDDLVEQGSGSDAPTEPVYLNGEAEFEEFVGSHDVVLVDFYADWCGPCKMLEPTVETLAADSPAAVAKVDIDANQPLAQSFGIRGVPTLHVYAGGQRVEQFVGVQDEATLRSAIEQHA